MFLTDVDADSAERGANGRSRTAEFALVGGAVTKTALAALAGFVLACGLGLVVWAVTPSAGDSPATLVRAGVAAFCAAGGMTLRIGDARLTLPPLMLTAVVVALLCAVVGRGRRAERDLKQELTFVAAAAVTFAVTVTLVGVAVGGHAVTAGQWWRPGLLALVVVGVTTLVRGTASRTWIHERTPAWVPVSLRLGAVGVMALFAGGAVTLVVGLIRTFSDASTVQTLAAPGAAGGFGMLMLGIAYLPNAVIAATGYSMGVGFTVGSGTYTPFGSSPVELPAVSFLTAVPDAHAVGRSALLVLLVPLVAGTLVGLGAVRRLSHRTDRLFAVAAASLLAAVVAAVVAQMASGGVSGGEWSTSGVPPVLFGAAVGVAMGAVSATVVAVARALPARAARVDVGDGTEDVGAIDAEDHDADDLSEDAAVEGADGEDADGGDSGNLDPGHEDSGNEDSGNEDSDVEVAHNQDAVREEDVIAGGGTNEDEALVTELRPHERRRRAG